MACHLPECLRNEIQIGDMVIVGESRKISKTKAFIIIDKLTDITFQSLSHSNLIPHIRLSDPVIIKITLTGNRSRINNIKFGPLFLIGMYKLVIKRKNKVNP